MGLGQVDRQVFSHRIGELQGPEITGGSEDGVMISVFMR